jgi:alpha-beta hydrolase superfamily lysophospholipase
MNEGRFQGVGGLNIFTRGWRPAGKPRGVVVLVHGFNSHSGMYQWAAEGLVSKGLALILHGTADKAAKPGGSKRFFEMAGSTDKAVVMADIQRWLDGHLSWLRLKRAGWVLKGRALYELAEKTARDQGRSNSR